MCAWYRKDVQVKNGKVTADNDKPVQPAPDLHEYLADSDKKGWVVDSKSPDGSKITLKKFYEHRADAHAAGYKA